ncbi:hypothetical protein THOD04_80015 [Vibrio owensii]|uniref:Uncharacterized protein n=1 Tax=Vibrio owensii TaxID=696485 RepID=A0AAU9QC59_9VIBR|nr:hypothetical protein THF1D04_60016 [Vibrio owensii]CAH1599847.1 hypothetical protein THOD04_80015 [Vibrio owensii]
MVRRKTTLVNISFELTLNSNQGTEYFPLKQILKRDQEGPFCLSVSNYLAVLSN